MNLLTKKYPPFFIIGSDRSGTTIMQTLLDNHPNIAIPPESHIYHNYSSLFQSCGKSEYLKCRTRFVDDLLRDGRIKTWKMELTSHDRESLLEQLTRADAIDYLFMRYAKKQNANRWGDKTPEHIGFLNLIIQDFPNALFIHLIRDGRDVAESFKRVPWGPSSIIGTSRNWKKQVLSGRTFFEEVSFKNCLEIHYEDLVTNTTALLKEIFDFLDEPYIDTTVNYENSSLCKNYLSLDVAHNSLKGGIVTNKIGRYMKSLTDREIELFEYIAGDALDIFKYQKKYKCATGPSSIERAYAWILDHPIRWYRKLQHPDLFRWEIQKRLRIIRECITTTHAK